MAVNKRRFIKDKVSCSCSMPGVWKAVAHSEGCVVVYHSPKACAHITEEMERNQYFRMLARREYTDPPYTAPLVTSNIGKKESIFGGSQLLKKCLDYVVATYSPKYIVVTDSCVSGVIGDDSVAVCQEAEQEHGVPILHIDCHGFLDGEYYGGFIATGKLLIDRFMVKTEATEEIAVKSEHEVNVPRQNHVKSESTNPVSSKLSSVTPYKVTLIGEKDGPSSLAIQQFCALIEDFGLEIYKSFPGYCSIEDMQKIGESDFTVILGGTQKAYAYLKEIADYMSEKLGIPHFASDYPIGWQGTVRWLDAFNTFLQDFKRDKAVQVTASATVASTTDASITLSTVAPTTDIPISSNSTYLQTAPAIDIEAVKANVWHRFEEGYEPYKKTLQAASIILCWGVVSPTTDLSWVLEWLHLGGLSLDKVVILDNVPVDQQKSLRKLLDKYYPETPAVLEQADTELPRDALIITTQELAEPFLRQLMLPCLPPIGMAGLVQMYRKLFMLVRRRGERGIVLYGW